MAQKRIAFSEQLRQAIGASPLTRYRISKETGISQSVLSLFCARKRGLSLPAIDAIANLLELDLKPRRPQKPRIS